MKADGRLPSDGQTADAALRYSDRHAMVSNSFTEHNVLQHQLNGSGSETDIVLIIIINVF
jgi:hypothetical protein